MRIPRVVIPDLPHHVVVRGNNCRRLFSYPREYQLFLFLLARGLAQGRARLHVAVLMTNHVHLLITPPTVNALSKVVKYTCQRYAQARNQAREQTGRLFDARYFSKPVLTDEQLAVTTAYIELNPARAGLVKALELYRWSTYALHASAAPSAIPRGLWSPSPWYLALGRDPVERRMRYRVYLEECRVEDRRPERVGDVDLREAQLSLARPIRLERPGRRSAL